MQYSIGEVSQISEIPISTLRYYDREGLFPAMERSSGGIRVFSDVEMEALKVIECLKATGMPIRDIRQFLNWCQEGDCTLQQRRDMFYERLDVANRQMEELQKTLDVIKYKCSYYDAAIARSAEKSTHSMPFDEMPEPLQKTAL